MFQNVFFIFCKLHSENDSQETFFEILKKIIKILILIEDKKFLEELNKLFFEIDNKLSLSSDSLEGNKNSLRD